MRGVRAALATMVVAAVVMPALRQSPRDGFPLSTYPMFASDRGREVAVATAVGVRGPDDVVRLDPITIADSDEIMLAAATVRRAVRTGAEARLCAEIADRLAGDTVLQAVEIRTETYDAIRYLADETAPDAITVHTRCEVPGS